MPLNIIKAQLNIIKSLKSIIDFNKLFKKITVGY